MTAEEYLDLALLLAAKAKGRTSPNPMVGALIVKEGDIVGRGFHPAAGQPHAEIFALREAGEQARQATMYVTLEPCNHQGRTPPCTEAIIAAGINSVVIGMKDPNPKVAGRGIARLQQAGIKVTVGIREKQCRQLNEAYCKFITTGMPFVTLKIAASMDGRIATRSGHSHWITNEESRHYVHQLRDETDAILIGIGTLLHDNPKLTTRLPHGQGRNPYRIIVDSHLRTPLHANIFGDDAREKLILATCVSQQDALRSYQERTKKILQIHADENGQLDLPVLMKKLASMGIMTLLVEGGSEISGSALEAGIVDKICFFYAPILIGGRGATGMLGGQGHDSIADSQAVTGITIKHFGTDLCLEGYLRPQSKSDND
ncbi:MAG: bifunctional diaminohydroxyphosphoribosylaminopyrimidine deaminase/5-amino-6-(5-phosphoribosylamino)uracil reductase RibD [Deltaproteobacteria bacterium]|nr:bifunctional diaminohydroxyphosphoribosylaminopyrimidine deaminase/5-amino-6-(5-phosphoribosylamino)uracil reductase RibD [Candidatus Anaeroferrophillus wilburensis]MBN2889043.1 bifunctional diaminohydroxyphosphoribosylaminopyrimidine deaminase/5-amino-6-(5-phosphoribosylamino)uracil reductase RibD [Deltaproteobacteria bacterium]